MNYTIFEQQFVTTDSNGIAIVRCNIFAKTAADIPAYNAFVATEKKQIAPGSVAILPSTGAVYMLDFDNTWKAW